MQKSKIIILNLLQATAQFFVSFNMTFFYNYDKPRASYCRCFFVNFESVRNLKKLLNTKERAKREKENVKRTVQRA